MAQRGSASRHDPLSLHRRCARNLQTEGQKIRRLFPPSALALLATALPVFAAEPAYLDDRSTAAALVRSFYNAVNRHEYARAYTYFGDNGGPQPYETFAQGYADTQYVTVATGTAQSDGTAGATYYTLPVAIDALQDGGVHQQFAGCYTTKLVDPDNEDPPVTPMYIFKATLHAAHGAIAGLLPHCEAE